MVTKVYSTVYYLILLLALAIPVPALAQHHCGDTSLEVQQINNSLRNARRLPQGPLLLGAWSSSIDVDRLTELGIEAVIGFHPLNEETLLALDEVNIDYAYFNFHWWRGWDEPWMPMLNNMLMSYDPDSIAIHCQHGVDRTGNAAAYYLAVYCDVPLADALYAVVANSSSHTQGVADVLQEFGIVDVRSPGDHGVNIYGYNGNGMHVNTEGFKEYVRQTIRSALESGASW